AKQKRSRPAERSPTWVGAQRTKPVGVTRGSSLRAPATCVLSLPVRERWSVVPQRTSERGVAEPTAACLPQLLYASVAGRRGPKPLLRPSATPCQAMGGLAK